MCRPKLQPEEKSWSTRLTALALRTAPEPFNSPRAPILAIVLKPALSSGAITVRRHTASWPYLADGWFDETGLVRTEVGGFSIQTISAIKHRMKTNAGIAYGLLKYL